MPSLATVAVVPLALFTLLASIVYPRAQLLGVFKTVEPLNNQQCRAIKGGADWVINLMTCMTDGVMYRNAGLVGCEDAWVDEKHGFAYL